MHWDTQISKVTERLGGPPLNLQHSTITASVG
jgi:hypothetical protein